MDIFNLFKEFEGIEMIGVFRKDSKCYSFLKCLNQDQLFNIITTKHHTDVCGRTLIVRAADVEVQKEIEKYLLKNNRNELHSKNTFNVSKMQSDAGYNLSNNYPQKQFSTPKSRLSKQTGCHSDFYDCTRSAEETGKLSHVNTRQDHFEYSDLTFRNQLTDFSKPIISNGFGDIDQKEINYSPFSDFQKCSPIKHAKNKNNVTNPKSICDRFCTKSTSKYSSYNNQNLTNVSHHSEYDEKKKQIHSRSSISYSQKTNNCSEISPLNDFKAFRPNLSFVSVLNFPLGLQQKDLYTLFSDFNPVNVIMVCNQARVDRKPTEAMVCFRSEQDATNAILTLDNTVYNGRIILVTNSVDAAVVSELLHYGRIKK
ncbi:uncharacterized protein CDAR_437301 [Caerostris darwini]|uniref:RRM domain-containing protein n=1 Tax=Caerostris darwini TaxID=1538125 RepID=A0AAV4QSM5_9ARAC|nr:uncharacterized protein CDAR_437301 [Caerostris darwini]